MSSSSSSKTIGVIAFSQEGRFLLRAESGLARLFVLAPSAGVEPQDLADLRGQRVEVTYEKAEGLIADLATALAEVRPG